MENMELGEFILRRKNQKIRNAIISKYNNKIDKTPEDISREIESLQDWAVEKFSTCGYKPLSIELLKNELDYQTKIGIGVLFEGERVDDIRGYWLGLLQSLNRMKKELDEMRAAYDDYREKNPENDVLEVVCPDCKSDEYVKIYGKIALCTHCKKWLHE